MITFNSYIKDRVVRPVVQLKTHHKKILRLRHVEKSPIVNNLKEETHWKVYKMERTRVLYI
jgi:hypothetical protein